MNARISPAMRLRDRGGVPLTGSWRAGTTLLPLALAVAPWAVGGLSLGALAGCDESEAAPAPTSLRAEDVLIRGSLDLRGIRPSQADLEAVRDDPEALDALLDSYVDDPRFARRAREFFAPAFRTRIDDYGSLDSILEEVAPDAELELATLQASIGEEPLDLVAYVVAEDLPFTEIVLADYTFVDASRLLLWPVEELPEGSSLASPSAAVPGVPGRYVDGRPHVGVLTMNAMWWRHSSTIENANRGRANAISRALLCESYLDRPVDFPRDIDLSDSESIRQAIRTNGGCQACHSTLDPLASYLWGFMYTADDLATWREYQIGREHDWQQYTDAPPGFFGEPGSTLKDLGRQIASDERFVSCTVRRVYEGMMGRPATLDDEGALAVHREAFLEGELRIRALARSIVRDPGFRGQPHRPRFGGDPVPVERKLAPLDVIESDLEHLTGYRMTFETRSALELDRALRAVAGGSDSGEAVLPSTGLALTQRRLAEAGARFVVDRVAEGAPGQAGVLGDRLRDVDLAAPPTPEDLRYLLRITTSRDVGASGDEVAALVALFEALEAAAGVEGGGVPAVRRDAWAGVLTALLADPDRLLY